MLNAKVVQRIQVNNMRFTIYQDLKNQAFIVQIISGDGESYFRADSECNTLELARSWVLTVLEYESAK